MTAEIEKQPDTEVGVTWPTAMAKAPGLTLFSLLQADQSYPASRKHKARANLAASVDLTPGLHMNRARKHRGKRRVKDMGDLNKILLYDQTIW